MQGDPFGAFTRIGPQPGRHRFGRTADEAGIGSRFVRAAQHAQPLAQNTPAGIAGIEDWPFISVQELADKPDGGRLVVVELRGIFSLEERKPPGNAVRHGNRQGAALRIDRNPLVGVLQALGNIGNHPHRVTQAQCGCPLPSVSGEAHALGAIGGGKDQADFTGALFGRGNVGELAEPFRSVAAGIRPRHFTSGRVQESYLHDGGAVTVLPVGQTNVHAQWKPAGDCMLGFQQRLVGPTQLQFPHDLQTRRGTPAVDAHGDGGCGFRRADGLFGPRDVRCDLQRGEIDVLPELAGFKTTLVGAIDRGAAAVEELDLGHQCARTRLLRRILGRQAQPVFLSGGHPGLQAGQCFGGGGWRAGGSALFVHSGHPARAAVEANSRSRTAEKNSSETRAGRCLARIPSNTSDETRCVSARSIASTGPLPGWLS